jgi:hypothetical protein
MPLQAEPNGTLVASFSGNVTPSVDDYAGSCRATGKDLVYSFVLEAPESKVQIALEKNPADASYALGYFVRSVCGDAATQVAQSAGGCVSNATGKPSGTAYLGPGTWYLFVDSSAGAGRTGEFTGKVTVTVLPDP